jgi:hypothetical protein
MKSARARGVLLALFLAAPALAAAPPAAPSPWTVGSKWRFTIIDGKRTRQVTFVVETGKAASCLGGDWQKLRMVGGSYPGVSEPAWRLEGGTHLVVLLASDICDRYDQVEGQLSSARFHGRHSMFGIEGSDDLGVASAVRLP